MTKKTDKDEIERAREETEKAAELTPEAKPSADELRERTGPRVLPPIQNVPPREKKRDPNAEPELPAFNPKHPESAG